MHECIGRLVGQCNGKHRHISKSGKRQPEENIATYKLHETFFLELAEEMQNIDNPIKNLHNFLLFSVASNKLSLFFLQTLLETALISLFILYYKDGLTRNCIAP